MTPFEERLLHALESLVFAQCRLAGLRLERDDKTLINVVATETIPAAAPPLALFMTTAQGARVPLPLQGDQLVHTDYLRARGV